jgi:hypothetical protein
MPLDVSVFLSRNPLVDYLLAMPHIASYITDAATERAAKGITTFRHNNLFLVNK